MTSRTVTLTPVTGATVRECLQSMELTFATFEEDAFIIPFRQHSVVISRDTDQPRPSEWTAHTSWNRRLNISYMALAKNAVQGHNATSYAPLMTLVVPDDGYIYFSLSWVFGWRAGATREQMVAEIGMLLSSVGMAFSTLNSTFHDPWMEDEESP
ncbi:MAG: hypothetical protein Q4P05_00205 [Actinomycetaceae bacterium]|nr:hypothetical protein [Actinomycetaceae bacterium]